MNKYYLESNLMAASPSSHLDSLYADLQMHALNVSDGLAKLLTTIGSGSLTTLTTVHPSKLQGYCEFLIARPMTHGTISNSLNGLVNVMAYVQSLCIANDDNSDFEDSPDTVDALIDTALKLRSQAEKQAKVQNLYKPRHPAWCSWPEAKQTRLNALAVMGAKLQQRPFN